MVVLAEWYMSRIVKDITGLANEVINILLKEVSMHWEEMKNETWVYYYRMIGDHYWYLAEVSNADKIGEMIDKA